MRRKQYDNMEEKINKLKLAKYGRYTNIFKMKEVVAGPKKSQQEPQAVIDSETEELVVGTEEIKKVTLKHCVNSLRNNIPEQKVEQIVELVNKVHDTRMKEVATEDDEEILIEDFKEVVNNIEKKHKKSYNFLTQKLEMVSKTPYSCCVKE